MSAAGAKLWQFTTAGKDVATGWVTAAGAVTSSPAVVTDGAAATLYFGSENGFLFAVSDPTGTLKWRFKTDGPISSSPAASADGLSIYVGSTDMHMYAVSHTGALKVRFGPPGNASSV